MFLLYLFVRMLLRDNREDVVKHLRNGAEHSVTRDLVAVQSLVHLCPADVLEAKDLARVVVGHHHARHHADAYLEVVLEESSSHHVKILALKRANNSAVPCEAIVEVVLVIRSVYQLHSK